MDLDHPDIIQEELRNAGGKANAHLFQNIDGENNSQDVVQIDSVCISCHEQGITKLLLTRIPFFKEVVVSSFACEKCGYRNNEVQSAGVIQEKGVKITLTVKNKLDLNRQVVKSDKATVKVPLVELEIPPQKGNFTTIEGLLKTASEELSQGQAVRRIMDPDTAQKIDTFIEKLNNLVEGTEPFELIIDDPTGNSYVENPSAPSADPCMRTIHYSRSKELDESLGIVPAEQGNDQAKDATTLVAKLSGVPSAGEPGVAPVEFRDEVLSFPTNCMQCNAPCQTNMKIVDIPHFKQVVIMAIVCDGCGYRNNEVKSASGIEDKGLKMTLRLTQPLDLSRDILKSDTAGIRIPELDLELEPGTLGGKFTTVEGLLMNIRDQLKDTNYSFTGGDSENKSRKDKIAALCSRLEMIASGQEFNIHIIVDDPTGNSYVQNIYAPDDDPELKTERYERNYEQNEELGLNDMKTENYS